MQDEEITVHSIQTRRVDFIGQLQAILIHCGLRANHNTDQHKAKLSRLFVVPRIFLHACVHKIHRSNMCLIMLDTCLKRHVAYLVYARRAASIILCSNEIFIKHCLQLFSVYSTTIAKGIFLVTPSSIAVYPSYCIRVCTSMYVHACLYIAIEARDYGYSYYR